MCVCLLAGLFIWLPCRRLGQATKLELCITSSLWDFFVCLGGCLQDCSFGYHIGDWGKPLISHVLLHDLRVFFVCVCRAVPLATM